MDKKKITKLSADLILRYYKNEPFPFLEHMDDDALWYGPAKGQFIRGREAMMELWKKENHALSFTIGNMNTQAINSHPSFCNVMLSYSVITHYPEGQDLSVYQRLLLNWGERAITDKKGNTKKEPRILVCHISNPHGKHEADVIYPKNFSKTYAGHHVAQKGEQLHFLGVDHSEYYFLSDTISWVESSGGGRRCILHGRDMDVEIFASISSIANEYHHLFLQCHQSFLVNPHYIRNVKPYQVLLSNNVELPISKKRYSTFRNLVSDYLIIDSPL